MTALVDGVLVYLSDVRRWFFYDSEMLCWLERIGYEIEEA